VLCGFIANTSFNFHLLEGIAEPILSYNLLSHDPADWTGGGSIRFILHIHNALFIAHLWAIYSLATYLWGNMGLGLVQTMTFLKQNVEQSSFDAKTVLEMTLAHYTKLLILAREFNRAFAMPMMYFVGTVWVQMIYNLYMVFQLIKMEAADGKIMAIVFYIQDAALCPVILFFMFKSLGGVGLAAENLRASITFKLRELESGERNYFRRLLKCQRIIVIRNGPSKINKYSVAKGTLLISNYYICAILW